MSAEDNHLNKLELLKVDDVKASYGLYKALFGVSMKIYNGEIVGLVGPNGSGKSTVARLVSGLIRPSAGKVYYLNAEISRMHAFKIARLGLFYIPEGRAVFSTLTVEENLTLFFSNFIDNAKIVQRNNLDVNSLPRQDSGQVELEDNTFESIGRHLSKKERIGLLVEETYKLFPKLKKLSKRKAGSLSGGEQRMLAISKAFVLNPKLIVFDELSLGLSPRVSEEIWDIISSLRETNTTMLILEQSLKNLDSTATRILRIESGKIVS